MGTQDGRALTRRTSRGYLALIVAVWAGWAVAVLVSPILKQAELEGIAGWLSCVTRAHMLWHLFSRLRYFFFRSFTLANLHRARIYTVTCLSRSLRSLALSLYRNDIAGKPTLFFSFAACFLPLSPLSLMLL